MTNPVDPLTTIATHGLINEPLHTLIYGDTGVRKSSSAATYPTPTLVCFFDPRGKERPYIVNPATQIPRGTQTSAMMGDTPVQLVYSFGEAPQLLCRIEHYIDAEVRKPAAFARFMERLTVIQDDITAWGIRTVVVDSVTFMELASRKQHQYVLNRTARDPRQWFGGSTDALEEVLMMQLGALDVNVVVIAHIDEEKSDMFGAAIRVPAAPGRLSRRRGLPSSYAELYRAYAAPPDERGITHYLWQTRSSSEFIAASQIGAPDPCPQDYRALWLRPGT